MKNNDQSGPRLFEFFPDLADNIGYINLETSRSPVQQLSNLGHENLWIKRDDIVSTVYGGNKVRRLEFVLADAINKGKDRIVTMGAIGTNHGLATAIFCNRLGLKCTLLLFDQEITPYVRQNLALFHRYGAEIIYLKTIIRMSADYYITSRLKYPGAYFLYAGGSSPIGTLGAVNAALEFAEQVEQGQCPAPDFVICPTASNGTMAGLMLGFMFAGLDTQVIGVRVGMKKFGPLQFNTPGTVARMIKSVHKLMKKNSKMVPKLKFSKPVIIDDYFGGGYGRPTPEGNAALKIFEQKENIKLDPVYTGKTCAALLDFIKQPGRAEDTVLYWHTFNSVDFSKATQEPTLSSS